MKLFFSKRNFNNIRFNLSWSSQQRLIIDNLKFLFNKFWETCKSSRAATKRESVLSSGMNNCLLLELPLVFVALLEPGLSLDSFALARSK